MRPTAEKTTPTTPDGFELQIAGGDTPGSGAPTTSWRQRGERRPLAAPPARTMLITASLLIICLVVGQVRCLSASQQQQQQSAAEQTLAAAEQQQQRGSGQGGGSLLSDGGGSSTLQLVNGYGLNTKRARKMSAFMPMRGRKDGRDDSWPQQRFVVPVAEYLPMHESQDSQDLEAASILRSLAALAAANRQQPPQRSFVDQLAARQRQQQQQQQPAQVRSGEVVFEEALAGSAEPSANVMQAAKLRRAFHPMRGKKFDPEMDGADQFGSATEADFDVNQMM